MQQARNPKTTGGGPPWDKGEAMELWKFFGGVGAADKNTMVTVQSLLLTFSAALIGYAVTSLLSFGPPSVDESFKGIGRGVALLGIAVSAVAVYVSLLYGGYSNWNWAQADAIAREQATRHPAWKQLLPQNATAVRKQWKQELGKQGPFCAIALWLGRPCDPARELAPIFGLYILLAVVAAAFHGWILYLSWS